MIPNIGIFIIIIINSHRTTRRISHPHCLTSTFCVLQPLLLLPSSSTLLCFAFFRSSSLWSSLALRPSGVHPNAVKPSISPSLLSNWPSQFHLLCRTSQRMSLILANSTTFLFVILCCHLFRSIRLRYWHWKLFSSRSSFLVIFQVSPPYSRTVRT